MNSKVILLSMAVVTVGLFAMPSTFSVFAGQHNFVAPDNVTCKKCHQDVYDNIQNSDMHKNLGTASLAWNDPANTNALGQCVGCHRVSDTYTNVTGIPGSTSGYFNQTPALLGYGTTHTMVVTLECAQCHTAVPAEFADRNETHQAYYNNSLANGTSGTGVIPLKGANAACVGCHTHTVVTINWTKPTGYNMNVTIINNNGSSSGYNMNFAMNTTTRSNITSSG